MIDRSRLGVVSNCWQSLLAQGLPLEDLIRRAVESCGFRHIELRQGALGAFEDSDRMPHVGALSKLADQFPEVSFDLAVELPVFSEPISRDDSRRQTYLDAAMALSGHLRIVDLAAITLDEAADGWLEMAVENLVSLADDLPGGQVSVEHSFQPWSLFWSAFARSGEVCGSALKLCFDPANLWLTDDGGRAADITQKILVETLSMVHLKQRRGDSTLTEFAAGDVDWQGQIQILIEKEYAGPFLFEIAPDENVWEALDAGVGYLDHLVNVAD